MVSTGTMTNRLDKLEKAGLIKRHRHATDRRGVVLQMTPAGRRVLDEYMAVQADRERALLGRLTVVEQQTLDKLLRRFLISMASEPERSRQV